MDKQIFKGYDSAQSADDNLVVKLQDMAENNFRLVKPALIKRMEILQEYSNNWYDEIPVENIRTHTPMNLVARAITTFLPMLASQTPRAMVRPRVVELNPLAELLRTTLNFVAEDIELGETLRTVTLDSLCYMGICKTGLSAGGAMISDAYGTLHDSGKLFVDPIYPEDYIFDMSARRKEEMDYEGNWFFIPAEFLLDSGLYKNLDALVKAYQDTPKESPEKISKGSSSLFEKTIRPYARPAEFWIPSEGIIVTIPPKGQGVKPLRIVEFTGPKDGPYDLLTYMNFPESVLPIAPIYANIDFHYFVNQMMRKMARQANREKIVNIYDGTAEDDAKAVQNAADGQWVKVANVKAFQEVKNGGTPDDAYKWVEWLMKLWNEQEHNINVVGGIAKQADTLGQEQMMYANATISVDDMIEAGHKFTKRIFGKMTHYLLTDPLVDIRTAKKTLVGEEIPVQFTYGKIKPSDFVKYNISVEPYSMQRVNPTIRLNRIMQIVSGIIVPLADLATAQGMDIDVSALIKLVGRDLDLTESEVDTIFRSRLKMPNTDLGPFAPPAKLNLGNSSGSAAQETGNRLTNLSGQQARAGLRSSPKNTPGVV